MKCICKKCEDCKLFMSFDMTGKDGLRKNIKECVFVILATEIPKIRGAIDGLQTGVNESRNRSMEAKDAVVKNTTNFVHTLKFLAPFIKQIGQK